MFFSSNLWSMLVGYHSQHDSIKFGYRLERKIEKSNNHAIFWKHATTYCSNMLTSKFFFLIMWKWWTIFFIKKKLCTCHKVENWTQKKIYAHQYQIDKFCNIIFLGLRIYLWKESCLFVTLRSPNSQHLLPCYRYHWKVLNK
jgi:hypothetical protein